MNSAVTIEPLKLNELLQAATQRAGGLSNFGQDDYPQALQRLLDAVAQEAQLSASGQLLLRERLIGQLVNRLVMEDYFERHPEIAEISIEDPLVIVGLPRTGTTMLQRTLAVDPRFYSAAWWETRYPAPFAEEAANQAQQRIEQAKAEVQQMASLIPQILAIHPLDAMLCDEEFMLMEHSFLCAMDAYVNVPSYTDWLAEQDQTPVYTQLKRMLQFLQWQKNLRGENSGQRWLLKAPQHLHTLDVMFKVFPKTQVILTHRDPAQTIPSMASMAHTLWQMYSDSPSPEAAGKQWNKRMSSGIRHTMQVRESIGTEHFLDIQFADTVAKPMEVLEKVYAFAGMPFTEQAKAAAQTWMAQNSREKRASHDYSLQRFGLSEQQMASDYAQYRERHLSSSH